MPESALGRDVEVRDIPLSGGNPSTYLCAAVGVHEPEINAGPLAELKPSKWCEVVVVVSLDRNRHVDIGEGEFHRLGDCAGAKAIQDAINNRYHIHLTINYTPATGGIQFASSLIQEVRAGQPASSDVLFSTNEIPAAFPYVQTVDYRKYLPGLPDDVMFYNHKSAAIYISLQAYDYNTKLVPPKDIPKTFSDLLKSEWKGKIASSASQGNFLNYIGLPSVMGHQGMIDFVTKFSGQVGGLFPCGEIDRVVSGEFWIFGVDCGEHEVRKRQRLGEPIAAMYPKEGTLAAYLDQSIPLTAVHPNAARLFVTFLLTREGQDLLWNLVATDNDRLPGSRMAPLMAKLRRQGVKFIDAMSINTLPEMSTYAKEIGAIINQGR